MNSEFPEKSKRQELEELIIDHGQKNYELGLFFDIDNKDKKQRLRQELRLIWAAIQIELEKVYENLP